jgi:flagellar L-ring protein FlgH
VKHTSCLRVFAIGVVAAFASLLVAPWVAAQTSSLYGGGQRRNPLTLAETSWMYQKSDEARVAKLHDLITVLVDEKSVMSSDGQMERKKKGYGDLLLSSWIMLDGLRKVTPDPQTQGSPHIRGEIDNKLSTQGQLQTADSLKFHIACNVIDIRPNGNLVIEGRRTIRSNEEVWQYSLRGEIRPESVQPGNSVLSENVAEMEITKKETGHVRDSYRRGWALEWLDHWQPF